MYKIKQSTNSPINLIWAKTIVAPQHNYSPAVGYFGHSGSETTTEKGFGNIHYALKWLNENPHPVPQRVRVIKGQCPVSPFEHWFIKED